MPKTATAAEASVVDMAEVSLPEETLKPTLPVIRAKVVYLGAMKNKSVCLQGQILVTYIEADDGTHIRKDPDGTEHHFDELKEAVDTGMTSYDFSTHDSRGRAIRERQMLANAAAHLRGKTFTWVDHIDHLRHFFMARGADNEKEFEVMVKPEHQAALQEHIRRSQRTRRAQAELWKDVVEGG